MLLSIEARFKIIQKQDDILWEKGKKDGWPKEVMDYLMWHGHENSRSTWYGQKLCQDLRICKE